MKRRTNAEGQTLAAVVAHPQDEPATVPSTHHDAYQVIE